MKFIKASDDQVSAAELLERAYLPDMTTVREQPVGLNGEMEMLAENSMGEIFEISLSLNEESLFKGPVLPGAPQAVPLANAAVLSGKGLLKLELRGGRISGFFQGYIQVRPGRNTLKMEFWSGQYPPVLILDNVRVNRPPGREYILTSQGMRTIGELKGKSYKSSVYFHSADEDLIPLAFMAAHRFKVWVNHRSLAPSGTAPGFVDAGYPVFNKTRLCIGPNSVRIAIPAEHRIIYDGTILIDGIHRYFVEIGKCEEPWDFREVTIKKGREIVFRGSFHERPFIENYQSR